MIHTYQGGNIESYHSFHNFALRLHPSMMSISFTVMHPLLSLSAAYYQQIHKDNYFGGNKGGQNADMVVKSTDHSLVIYVQWGLSMGGYTYP